jgi:hypothetical protein
MYALLAFIVCTGFFEIRYLYRAGCRKEIALHIALSATALILGYLYISDPYRESFSRFVLKALKMIK